MLGRKDYTQQELLSESLMNNGGELRGNNVIKYVPDESKFVQ